MNKRKEKAIRAAFERNLEALKNDSLPDFGDVLRAGGMNETDINQVRKYVLIYSMSEDVVRAAKELLRQYPCSKCIKSKGDCGECVSRRLRKEIKDWVSFDKEYGYAGNV